MVKKPPHSLIGGLAAAEIDVLSFDLDDARRAAAAYSIFGKGAHAAKLNLGDCVSYSLARHRDEPLLYKGNDFSKTDVPLANMKSLSPLTVQFVK